MKLSISQGKPRNRERKTERPMPMMGLEVMMAKLCKKIKSKRKDSRSRWRLYRSYGRRNRRLRRRENVLSENRKCCFCR